MRFWRQFDHSRFEELCALDLLGEISSAEKHEVEEHLRRCRSCRAMARDFKRIALIDMPAVAAERHDLESTAGPELPNAQQLFARTLQRVQEEQAPAPRTVKAVGLAAVPVGFKQLGLAAGLALTCVIVFTFGSYFGSPRMEVSRTHGSANVQPSPRSSTAQQPLSDPWKERATEAEMKRDTLSRELKQSELRNTAALASINQLRSAYKDLQNYESAMEGAAANQAHKLQDELAALHRAQDALDLETHRSSVLRDQLIEANNELAQLSQAPARPTPPEPQMSDSEARELFGARDLHIVDVYDVDRTGKTRNIYGRVYYVNHRLLLFYAFDLDRKSITRKPVGFQAWGFREPNLARPENLGLFKMDDASTNRWVLRVSNPAVLSAIDTVFVTLEPPEGSPSPRGRQLLFASLAGPANHP